jgi:serine/threonine protein kinase, bacterial
MPLVDGEVIAGYTILRSLGAGGMGEVYLAQHPRLPRRDALKLLSASVSSESEYRQRFNREADIAATLWHPHIVEVHDRGDVDGQLWISMDYVEGPTRGACSLSAIRMGCRPTRSCESWLRLPMRSTMHTNVGYCTAM